MNHRVLHAVGTDRVDAGDVVQTDRHRTLPGRDRTEGVTSGDAPRMKLITAAPGRGDVRLPLARGNARL
eukprot:4046528-Lingulodinium_polyedra.AAC.1